MLSQKVYVILKAFDSKSIEKSIRSISLTAKRGGAKVIGPISLPTKILKITVNKSPHVHKDSREQFERRSFKRLLGLIGSPSAIQSLMGLQLPAGVIVDLKVVGDSDGEQSEGG